jgi:hypothetical protein
MLVGYDGRLLIARTAVLAICHIATEEMHLFVSPPLFDERHSLFEP